MIPWRVWKITLSQMQMPSFAFGVKYVFSKDIITLCVGENAEDIKWDTFKEIVETSKDFRFFVDKVRAQIIPKHNLDVNELNMFKSIIKEASKEHSIELKIK